MTLHGRWSLLAKKSEPEAEIEHLRAELSHLKAEVKHLRVALLDIRDHISPWNASARARRALDGTS
jgi:hypothetical protein